MRPNLGRVGQTGDSPQDWYNNLPIITKTLLTGGLLLAASIALHLLNPQLLPFLWPNIWKKFEIWRLFTSFLFAGTFGFPFVMHMYMLYQNSLRYEMNPFNTGAGGTSADYLWMLIFGVTVLSILAYVFEFYFLSEPLLYMISYVWCRREPDAMVNIFGFQFKALYLPWVYLAIRILMGADIVMMLIGIGVGHLYYFLIEILPNTHNVTLIRTPQLCIDFIQYVTGMTQPTPMMGVPPPAARAAGGADRPAPQRGYNWGAGRALGHED